MRTRVAAALIVLASCNKEARDELADSAKREVEERVSAALGSGVEPQGPDEVFPDPPPGPVGLARGRYRVISAGATVSRRNASGGRWDLIGGAPADPALDLLVDGEKLGGCMGAEDVPRVVCTFRDKVIRVDGDTELRLVVRDDDVVRSESIGGATASELLDTGRAGRMKLAVSGQVTSAYVELVHLPDPPSAWATRRWSVFGLAAGVLGGLAFVLGLRSRLFRIDVETVREMPSVKPTIGWRCKHCDADNTLDAETCHHCGGPR